MSICMPDLVVHSVVASGGLPSVIAPPRDTASSSGKVWPGDDALRAGSASIDDCELAIMSEFSSDTDLDMEDEL